MKARVERAPGRGRPEAAPQARPGWAGRRRVDGPAAPAPRRRRPARGPGPADPGRPGGPGRRRRPRPRPGGLAGRRHHLCLRTRNLAYLVAGRPVDALPTDPVALERLARAMGEPGRQRLLEDYRRATRRARRVVDARFWDGPLDVAGAATAATRPADAGSPGGGGYPSPGEAAHGYPQPPLLVGVGDLMVDVSVEAPALARGATWPGRCGSPRGVGGERRRVGAAAGAGAAGGWAGRRPGRAAAGRRPGRAGVELRPAGAVAGASGAILVVMEAGERTFVADPGPTCSWPRPT